MAETFTRKEYENLVSSYKVAQIDNLCLVITDRVTISFDKKQLGEFIENLFKIYRNLEEKTD